MISSRTSNVGNDGCAFLPRPPVLVVLVVRFSSSSSSLSSSSFCFVFLFFFFFCFALVVVAVVVAAAAAALALAKSSFDGGFFFCAEKISLNPITSLSSVTYSIRYSKEPEPLFFYEGEKFKKKKHKNLKSGHPKIQGKQTPTNMKENARKTL